MADKIQLRRDTAARWAQYNPVLLEGEIGVVTDDPNQYKIGDGVHAWNELPLRGFDGTLVHELGYSQTTVMSQKGVTDEVIKNNYKIKQIFRNSAIFDYAVSDPKGNVILYIKDGNIFTKGFRSEKVPVSKEDVLPFKIADENGNVVLLVDKHGEFQIGKFYSRNSLKTKESLTTDFEITDSYDNPVLIVNKGHVKTKNFDSNNIIKERETIYSDFEIVDANDNVVLSIKDGRIKTKNFDSNNATSFNILEKFKGKKLSLLGDSISTYSGYSPDYTIENYDGAKYANYYPRGEVNNVIYTYWWKVCDRLGITLLQNAAWSGSVVSGDSTSTTTARSGCSDKRISDLAPNGVAPDIVLIDFGINDVASANLGDWNELSPIPSEGIINDFSSAYALMVWKIQVAYPKARIFCCTLSASGSSQDKEDPGKYPTSPTKGLVLQMYNEKIRLIADCLGADVIELERCGLHFNNFNNYTLDKIHPNKAGHELMANKIIAELIAKY